jgi:pyruvate/2-oxoglutarate dehydrogenase complex dihydrolipoamide dehydrogenase (E3) component
LFRLPAKVDRKLFSWVTFTEPELAHAGLSEADAIAGKYRVKLLRWPFHENDRAQAERETHGHVKVVIDKKGRILGATILGAHAGELIQMWSLAISQGLKIRAMTGWISPYPTYSEVNKRAAYRNYVDSAGSPLLRRIIGWLAKLG